MRKSISKFFVSYSHADQAWADHLFNTAIRTTRNISVPSIDFQRLMPGDDFDKKLKHEIKESDGFVFLVSTNFLESEYVREKECKWIDESTESKRVCCIEIGKAFSNTGSKNDSELLAYLKNIHRDTGTRLPVALPKTGGKLEQHVAAVRRSIERMLDPEGMRIISLPSFSLTTIDGSSASAVMDRMIKSVEV